MTVNATVLILVCGVGFVVTIVSSILATYFWRKAVSAKQIDAAALREAQAELSAMCSQIKTVKADCDAALAGINSLNKERGELQATLKEHTVAIDKMTVDELAARFNELLTKPVISSVGIAAPSPATKTPAK